MPIRIFVAPQESFTEGDFTFTASRLNRYVDGRNGNTYDEIDIPGRNYSISCVTATAAILTSIEADSLITALTPARVADFAALAVQLNTPVSSFTTAWRNAAKAKLESWGVNTDWIVGTSTIRQILRAFLKWAYLSQRYGLGESLDHIKAFINAPLTATVGDLTVAQRNGLSTWMQSKNIPVTSITLTTTLRDVQKLIATNYPFPNWIFGDGSN